MLKYLMRSYIKNVPDFEEQGFSKINVIYEDGVVSTNYHVKNEKALERRFIHYVKIKNKATLSNKEKIPVVLDVEHWSLYSKDTKRQAEKKLW